MDITLAYQEILEKIKDEKRPFLRLDQNQRESLALSWREALGDHQNHQLKAISCILEHSTSQDDRFDQLFIESLSTISDANLLIYFLSASQKHVIERAHRIGEPVSIEFIKVLRSLLSLQDPELYEWTLRTIESLGPQNLILKDAILSTRPNRLNIFNKHSVSANQIINLLQRQWNELEQRKR